VNAADITRCPDCGGLTDQIQTNGMDDEAAGIMLMFCDQIEGLLRIVRAKLSGELNPLTQDEFDAAIESIMSGGA
jgi:hypothetical protein